MKCVRLPDGEWPRNPGEIAKHTVEGQPGPGEPVVTQVMWFFIAPNGGGIASIGPKPLGGGHEIDELPDHGIQVVAKEGNSNSILVHPHGNGTWHGWHGYIRDGKWVSC